MDSRDIKASIDLRDYIEKEMGRPAKNGGEAHFWPCPFHSDRKTPSLAVYIDHWFCFGCQEHGDIFDWVKKRHGIDDFMEVCQMLNGGQAMTRGYRSPSRPYVPDIKTPPGKKWRVAAESFMVSCAEALWSTEPEAAKIRAYLEARGLQSPILRKRYIGFSWQKWYDEPGAWGLDEGKKVFLPWGIVIPNYYNLADSLWSLKIRQRKGEEPKYIHVRGSVPTLYSADTLPGNDVAVMCEGEFDSMLLEQVAGDLVGTVTYGSATTRDVDTWLSQLVNVKRLFVATDNDEAGEKSWQFWQGYTRRARRLLPPGGCKDITDAWKAGHDLRAWVQEALHA